ncbi:MAG: TIM barrel protein [Candidatus Omnitrophota bacterium]
MGLVLSTSWNASRYTRGKGLVFEIKKLGFEEIELSFNLTAAMVDDIALLARNGQIKVSSVHNFCPIPNGVRRQEALPDYFSLASTDECERKKAVALVKISVDTALRLNAKAVVLHCGRVEVPDRTRDLICLYARGQKDSSLFRRIRNEAIQQRRLKCRAFFQKALKSLEALGRYAVARGISLGIETRFYYREIPSFEEIGVILKKLRGGNMFYWHDTGHAQIMENLGYCRHKDYLRAYSQRMLGIHLHGIIGCVDHQAPTKSDFDFRMLKGYLKPATIKVIEAHRSASHKEIKASGKFLKALLG